MGVSIHTPTQGVTESFNWWGCICDVSIHTPTQGVTMVNGAAYHNGQFQSTHPRRVWHRGKSSRTGVYGFNPHTHAGCDITADVDADGLYVSIHTPTQGVTPMKLPHCARRKFQSTHPRRVWLPKLAIGISSSSFNPHTHAGCDSTKQYSIFN